MSKAVLVMDMPSSCSECNFQQYGVCHAVRKSIVGTPTDLKRKPDWCPLRELPKKKPTIGKESDNDILCMNAGYNACIDELLKEE